MIEDNVKALVPRGSSGLDRTAFEPGDGKQGFEMAKWAVTSGFWPALNTPEKAFMVIAQGRALGLSALAALNGIDIINGRPSLRASTMIALVLTSGRARYFRQVEDTPERCTWETIRVDEGTASEPIRMSFTLEDAKRMGLLGRDQWQKQPQTMLAWRAASKLARRIYPDVTQGLLTTEELDDDHRQPTLTVHSEPSAPAEHSTAEMVRAKLTAQGVKLTRAEEVKGKGAKGKAKEESALVQGKQRLTEIWKHLCEVYGRDLMDQVWPDAVGRGAITDENALERVAKGEDLIKRLDLGAKVTELRKELSELTGEPFERVDVTQATTIGLAHDLEGLTDRLQTATTTEAREPGEEG